MKNLYQALAEFHKTVGKIAKDGKNPHFKSKYATLSALQEAMRQPLEDTGLIVQQKPTPDGLITCIIHAESGESECFTTPIICKDDRNPQAMGSAITYARRYAFGSYFNLHIDDDDDGKLAARETKGKPQKAASQVTSKPELKEDTVMAGQNMFERAVAYYRESKNLDKIEESYIISDLIRSAIVAKAGLE